MALRASYVPSEGPTDEGHPRVWQPWWYPTSNLRHVTHTDLDTDAAGRQVPVDVRGQDQLSLHHASDHYQNLNYFNPRQGPLIQPPPDPTTYGARTPGMPIGPDMSMNYLESHLDPIVSNNVQGEPLPGQYSTNMQFGYFRPWREPLFPQPVSDTRNGTQSQTFIDNSPMNYPIDVAYTPQHRELVQNPSEPPQYFDRWQEPSFLPPSTSNIRTVGPSGSTVRLDNEIVAANSYYSEAHDYTFSSFTTDHPQGQVPPQAPSSSWHPSYANLWQGPYIHPSVTSDLPFGPYHHPERYVSDAEAHNDLAPLRVDQLSLGTIRSPKPTTSSIEGSGPSSTPIAGSSATTKDATWRERRRPAEAKFSCTFCPRVFTAKHNYKYHMQAHRGERPHRCDVCGTFFGRRSDLKRHKRSKKHLDALQFRRGEYS